MISVGLAIIIALPQHGSAAGEPRLRPEPVTAGVKTGTGSLAMELQSIANLLLDGDTMVSSVADRLGTLKPNRYGGPELDLDVRDGRFLSGVVGIDSDPGQRDLAADRQRALYVRLVVATGVDLSLDSMQKAFGTARNGTPSPHGNPYSLVFYYPSAVTPTSVAVFAMLSGPPDAASTVVTSVLLRVDHLAEAARRQQR